MKNKVLIILSFILIRVNIASANEVNQDFMRQMGKMNVVIAVIVATFLGLAIYMIRLDTKLSALEKAINKRYKKQL